MMENYVRPEMKIIRLPNVDIITDSSRDTSKDAELPLFPVLPNP